MSSDAPYIIDAYDWKSRRVRMTRRTFERHVPYHPEIVDYIGEAQEAIADPDIVLEADNGANYLYRFGLGRSPFSRLWLMVVVYYQSSRHEEEGTIATYFFTDSLDQRARQIAYRAQMIGGQRFRLDSEGGKND